MKQISIIILSLLSVTFFTVTNLNNSNLLSSVELDSFEVDITGAVENRGIFLIEPGDVILDVLNKPEYGLRLTKYADKNSFDDPLKEVENGMELFIPYKEGFEPSEPIPCIDNLTIDILTKHGITSNTVAKNLIEYIKKVGMVKQYSELIEVTGIGTVTLGKISEFSKLC